MIAESKIESLLAAEAHVVVVAPEVTEAVGRVGAGRQIEWQARAFAAEDLGCAFLVVAGTSSAQLNHGVFRQCEAEGILLQRGGRSEYCHFYYPAVVRRGPCRSRFPPKDRAQRWRSGCARNSKPNPSGIRIVAGMARCGAAILRAKGKIPRKRRSSCINLRAKKCSKDFCVKASGTSGN